MVVAEIGVVGCGQMGGGIALVCARAGYRVVIMEQSAELLRLGMDRIDALLRRDSEKGKITDETRLVTLANIRGDVEFGVFNACDLIIEAVVEDIDEKKRVFKALDGVAPPHCILASNTSSVCIMEIAAVTGRRSQVGGMHFFNPVPVMPIVELVRTLATRDETIEVMRAVAGRLNKAVVLAKDTPGFIVNLLLIPYLLDAIRALEQNVASRDDIDTAMKLGCGLPMGPLTLADFIGLDTVLFIGDVLHGEFQQEKYAAPPLLRRMVLAGNTGRKSGHGFYNYPS